VTAGQRKSNSGGDGLATGYRQAGHCYRGKNQLAQALAQYDKGLGVMVELTRQLPEAAVSQQPG
jgi:hypothetical protein